MEQEVKLNCSRTGRNQRETLKNEALSMSRLLSETSGKFDLELSSSSKKNNTQKSSIYQVFDQFETSFSSQLSEQQDNSTTRMPKYPFSNSLSPLTRDSQLEETRRPDFFLVNQKSLIVFLVRATRVMYCGSSGTRKEKPRKLSGSCLQGNKSQQLQLLQMSIACRPWTSRLRASKLRFQTIKSAVQTSTATIATLL